MTTAALTTALAPSAAAAGAPTGSLDAAVQSGSYVDASGWAYDPSTSASATVKVVVDGKRLVTVLAHRWRSDIGRAHRSYGNWRGWTAEVSPGAGKHAVCAYVLNSPSTTAWTQLGCRSVTVNVEPWGRIDSITQSPSGTVSVGGWAIDPDRPQDSITVQLQVDGATVSSAVAGLQRPDIGQSQPAAGAWHGYSMTVPMREGTHHVCARAINIGLGADRTVACTTVHVNHSPVGAIRWVTQRAGGFHVVGWAADPDTASPVQVTISADGTTLGTVLANAASTVRDAHGFVANYFLPGTRLAPGGHSICAVAHNLGKYGRTVSLGCTVEYLDYNPTATTTATWQRSPGDVVGIAGWAQDPDTSAPVSVHITVDGTQVATILAGDANRWYPGHHFTKMLHVTNGTHTICAIAVNTRYGSGDSAPSCRNQWAYFSPSGALDSAVRVTGTPGVTLAGWALDPDTAAPIRVHVYSDGTYAATLTANGRRSDIGSVHPGFGNNHGFSGTVNLPDGEHSVCVRAMNVQSGYNHDLGCQQVAAINPSVPAAPTSVTAVASLGGATIGWTAPASDGGAPWTSYTITSAPGNKRVTVTAKVSSATVTGLSSATTYQFSVVATNVAGNSPAGTSGSVRTPTGPAAQTTAAPISTSRYTRNLRGSSAGDLRTMRAEGAADAANNPSGHAYLQLLDIGGQDESRRGVMLSTGVRFVSYSDLVKCVQAYVDGFASGQRSGAPATIALGTNNDMDVWRSAGASWANLVVDPVAAYARKYPNITIAGASDIEPGFTGDYAETAAWLSGYLASTGAAFVNNGSADGCGSGYTGGSCNNGWTMARLYALAGGLSPHRIIGLPQVYFTSMARQWRYISLTGVRSGQPKINFGGTLTEYSACQQASCGSMSGTNAWNTMWAQLSAEPSLKPATMPYATDLRIDW